MSFVVLKGLGASPHQRMMFWAPKTEVMEPRKTAHVYMVGAYVRIHDSYVCMLPKNPNFDCSDGLTLNGHNSLNVNQN